MELLLKPQAINLQTLR